VWLNCQHAQQFSDTGFDVNTVVPKETTIFEDKNHFFDRH